jgi:hypothetical protein
MMGLLGSNCLIGLSSRTSDPCCGSGLRACTAKLHQASERKSIDSGCASEGDRLKSKDIVNVMKFKKQKIILESKS